MTFPVSIAAMLSFLNSVGLCSRPPNPHWRDMPVTYPFNPPAATAALQSETPYAQSCPRKAGMFRFDSWLTCELCTSTRRLSMPEKTSTTKEHHDDSHNQSRTARNGKKIFSRRR